MFLARSVLRNLIRPGGRFFFTNIARGNPYRHWIDYLANWSLIERSEQDVATLVATGGRDFQLQILRDSTGLALLASATRSR
jgi:hypothetical protein